MNVSLSVFLITYTQSHVMTALHAAITGKAWFTHYALPAGCVPGLLPTLLAASLSFKGKNVLI
jgi:hypothetical protein